jgi:hypothetical protein
MVNAWSLLYEELYGDMDKEYPIMKKKEDEAEVTLIGGEKDMTLSGDPDFGGDSFNFGTSIYGADTVPYTYFGGADDTMSFSGTYNWTGYSVDLASSYQCGEGSDHISFGSDPYPTVGGSLDTLELTSKPQPNLKYKRQKYDEDKGIEDLKDYVSTTYQGHYTNENSDVQTLDLIHSVGDAESFCRSNALKYLSRYDKKGQAKRDILKAMHYCLLLYYFSGNTNNETPTRGYETF